MVYDKILYEEMFFFMRIPSKKDEIKITINDYIFEGKKLDILEPSEVYIKEKTDGILLYFPLMELSK